MKSKNAHFAFFESYHRALSRISNETYGRVVRAMCDYYFKGQEPIFDDAMDYVVWDLIEPILTKGKDISSIRAEAGKTGGCKGKGISRNIGNCNAKIINELGNSKANNSKSISNKSGIGIGVGVGYKENTNVSKKDELSLPHPPQSEKFVKFNGWLQANCPHLLKMQQMTEKELDTLLTNYQSEDIFNTLRSMENYKDTAKKNRSVYRTLRNWLNRDNRKKGGVK